MNTEHAIELAAEQQAHEIERQLADLRHARVIERMQGGRHQAQPHKLALAGSSPAPAPNPNPNATPEAYALAHPYPKGRWT